MTVPEEKRRVYALIRALYGAARTASCDEHRLEMIRKAAALEEALLTAEARSPENQGTSVDFARQRGKAKPR